MCLSIQQYYAFIRISVLIRVSCQNAREKVFKRMPDRKVFVRMRVLAVFVRLLIEGLHQNNC